MHLRQRQTPPVRARGKKRPVAARCPDAARGCVLPPRPENCSSPLPARPGEETPPSGAPASDPSPAPFSLPPDIAPPSAGGGHTRPAPPRGSWAGSHSRNTSNLPDALGPDVAQSTTPRGACHRHRPASSVGRETWPATTPWPPHSTRYCATPAGVVRPAPHRPGGLGARGPGPGPQ